MNRVTELKAELFDLQATLINTKNVMQAKVNELNVLLEAEEKGAK